jgi:tRNA nucleotidyltransferase (CCA-adding enzyme)
MSAPVHHVTPELPLAELAPLLDAWGHHGAPVLRAGAPCGVISRRDLARARDANRLELPVSSHMSGRVITTTPDAPVEAALAKMVEHDVGRLPVLREGALVGIVTRSDLLALLYSDSASAERSAGAQR